MRAVFGLTVGKEGRPVLPGEVLWALALGAGDLLVTERSAGDRFQLRFRSYAEAVQSAADFAGAAAWPWVERLFELPLAAVDCGGGLVLPHAGEILLAVSPGARLVLRAYVEPGRRGFTLRRMEERNPGTEIQLQASYALPVEDGSHVRLPADLLWALALQEGDLLAYEAKLAWAEYRDARDLADSRGLRRAEIEAGGRLALPASEVPPGCIEPGTSLPLTISLGPYAPRFSLDLRPLWIPRKLIP